jgi:hypothetical protein
MSNKLIFLIYNIVHTQPSLKYQMVNELPCMLYSFGYKALQLYLVTLYSVTTHVWVVMTSYDD